MDVNKVIVEVQLDFNEESDKALKVLFNVAEELLDKYNLWVEILPVHLWFTDPLEAELSDLPKIFINGKLRFIGKAPNKKEIIKAILEHAGLPPKTSESLGYNYVKVNFDGGMPEAVLISESH
ncbi:MAG: thioredoxin family protein [Desulfurococcaceae archaeon]